MNDCAHVGLCCRVRSLCLAFAVLGVLLLPGSALAQSRIPPMPVAVDLSKAPVGAWAEYSLHQDQAKSGRGLKTTVRWALVARDKRGATLEATAHGGPKLGSKVVMRTVVASDVSKKKQRAPIKKLDLQVGSHAPLALSKGALGMQQRLSKPDPKKRVNKGRIKTAAGTFQTVHYRERVDRGSVDIWVSDRVPPLGLVKMTFTPKKRGGARITAELLRSGKGAKSAIVKKPVRLNATVMRKLAAPGLAPRRPPVPTRSKRAKPKPVATKKSKKRRPSKKNSKSKKAKRVHKASKSRKGRGVR